MTEACLVHRRSYLKIFLSFRKGMHLGTRCCNIATEPKRCTQQKRTASSFKKNRAPLSATPCAKICSCLPKKTTRLCRVNRSWPTRSKIENSFKNKLIITARWFSRRRLSFSKTRQTCLISACRSFPSSFRMKRTNRGVGGSLRVFQ